MRRQAVADMPSWDEAKAAVHGHTSAGRIHPDAARWTVRRVLEKCEGETDDSYRVEAFVEVDGVRWVAATWLTAPALKPVEPGDTFRPWLPSDLLARARREPAPAPPTANTSPE